MGDRPAAILVVLLLSAAGVLADAMLKRSSAGPAPFATSWFAAGLALYSTLAFGWVVVLRHLKLATVGVLYGVFTLLLLTAVGVGCFGERIGRWELLGVALAVAAVALLARFG
jgi:small multidrug resistance pump